MTYYPDFCEESMMDAGSHIRAIGWLDDQHDFATGESPAEFVSKLRKITEQWRESVNTLGWGFFRGFHTCELCNKFMSSGNVGIPADNLLYVAPEMISHYVEQHKYLPPKQFIDAVLKSPIPGTEKYITAVANFCELYKNYRKRR